MTAVPLKGRAPCEDMVKDGAERIDVAALVELIDLSRRLLRGHVARRTCDRADAGLQRLVLAAFCGYRFEGFDRIVWATDHLRKTPIDDQDLVEATDHDVGGFQVTMDHAA